MAFALFAGKSSVLERLTMMPLFPRNDDPNNKRMTTLVAVHVNLRRDDKEKKVHIQSCHLPADSKLPPVPIGKAEELTWEQAHTSIHAKMKELADGEEGSSPTDSVYKRVCKDRIIQVTIHHPSVPSLNLIDLPGN
jgi:hypothetical protein